MISNFQNKYLVSGMTCDGCVESIKTKLELESDILEVNINLSSTEMNLSSNKIYSTQDLNNLVKNIGSYTFNDESDKKNYFSGVLSYFDIYKPIFISLFIVFVLAIISSIKGDFKISEFMRYYMGYFFIIFSFLKLQNIRLFANTFQKYDPITKRFYKYGLIYPFLEFILGILFLSNLFIFFINVVTILIFIPQIIGIRQKLSKKETIVCACLGSSFDVPISNLTIAENLVMILMAGVMIFNFI